MDVFQIILRHEGEKLFPYCDKCGNRIRNFQGRWICYCIECEEVPGNITIGRGRNLSSVGITRDESLALSTHDIAFALTYLHHWGFYDRLDVVRQAACIDLCVNLGVSGFDQFRDLIADLQQQNFPEAAKQLRNSLADHQEPRRIDELAKMIETGEWPTGTY